MQNKPNFLDSPMNITFCLTKHYDNFRPLGRGKNKPNSNPIQTQCEPNQTQFHHRFTSGKPYAKTPDFEYNTDFAQYELIKITVNRC
jgi:hypothetical protein